MKTNLLSIAIISWVLVGCDPQGAEPIAKQQTPTGLELGRQKLLEGLREEREIAAREKEIAAVRADLAEPWTSLVIALQYDCSCTGTSYSGFRINREAGGFSVSPWSELAGWSPTNSLERTGDSRQISKADVEKLLSETALFYLAATLSESVLEKVGPRPKDKSKEVAWKERYLAAGGSLEGGDRLWMDIRVVTSEGMRRDSNMWEMNVPSDFSNWITAFGELPR